MSQTPLRVWSWNLDGRAGRAAVDRQVAAIGRARPHLLLAQEVTRARMDRIAPMFDWVAFSTPDLPRYLRRWGTAVFGRAPLALRGQHCIAPDVFALPAGARDLAMKFSRYATWAEVDLPGDVTILAGSLHAKPAAGEAGARKPYFHAGVDRWLEAQPSPWIFGIDANTPGRDHHDETEVDWCWPMTEHWPGEDQLLGEHRRHTGRDLLRDVHQPGRAMPWSYRLRRGPVRYDHLWATPEVRTTRVDYRIDLIGASDHAAVDATVLVEAARTTADRPVTAGASSP